MGQSTVFLRMDASALEALFAAFLECSFEARQAFVGGLHALGDAAFVSRTEREVGAADATQQVVVFEPSRALLDLAATARALDLDGGVVQHSSHGHPSRKVVDCEK